MPVASRNSHSQMISTRHPSLVSLITFSVSLACVRRIFDCQNSVFVAGIRDLLQPCQCHKHPWTKTTVLCFRSTRSGRPGSNLLWIRNRNPAAWRARRTYISGLVSLDRTSLMILLRSAEVTLSALMTDLRLRLAREVGHHRCVKPSLGLQFVASSVQD